MWRMIRSGFAWQLVRDTDVHTYWENRLTGERRIVRYRQEGYQPVDYDWLRQAVPKRPAPRPSITPSNRPLDDG